MAYGNSDGNGDNAYNRDNSGDCPLETYVRLRREDPYAEVEISLPAGMDQLFYLRDELESCGISLPLVAGVLDADPDDISELSLQLMERIIEGKARAAAGETHLGRRHLVVPDKLINWLICRMLCAVGRQEESEIPQDLIVLIRERLGGFQSDYERTYRALKGRFRAIFVGAVMKAKGEPASMRSVARIMNVAPSTVTRWFPQGDFQEIIENRARFYDSHGNRRPLHEVFGRSSDEF